MKKPLIIYKITNIVTGKLYIGQTVMPLARRWAQHKNAKRKCPLTSSIQKHGISKFVIEPICYALTLQDLDALEIQLIAHYGTVYPRGYNLLPGGNISQNNRGKTPWNKGKKASEETRAKLSASHKGQKAWNKGITTPGRTREKQSKAKQGRRVNPATEFKAGQPSAFKGRSHSEESKALLRMNNGVSRRVQCVETGEYYLSMAEASRKTGIDKTSMQELVKSGRKHTKTGLTFKFV